MKTLTNFTASIALAAAMLMTSNNSAVAHADLVQAEPAPNARITEAPRQIKLVFSEALQAVGNSITLQYAQGAKIAVGKAELDPADTSKTTLIASVPEKLPIGTYSIGWKNLSEDGHSEKGSYKFALAAPAAAANTMLKFAFVAGKEAVACGKEIQNIGAGRNTAQIMDARFYITNIRLIDAQGIEVPFVLTPDNKWQSDKVALLDFEDGTGLCRDGGNSDLNDTVKGKAPAESYTGIVFDLGLPFEMNHADVATSKTPLNIQALWWNWQNGYKFARIDLATNAAAPNNNFFIHLGSTGCGEAMMDHAHGNAHVADTSGTKAMTSTMAMTATTKMDMSAANKAPSSPCANPNLVSIRLNKFDPTQNRIVADLASLLTNVNLAQSKPMPAGCMSGIEDPDCTRLFPNLGLSLKSGVCQNNCRGQRFFRVEALPK